jgi:pimeloyl-ACP methyl ester carboxylesterase
MTGTFEAPRYKNKESKARYLAAYIEALKSWPVPFERLSVPTRFGTTTIIASGPKDAPPVLLLHSLAATATSWRPNAEALSKQNRTLAIDIIGQCGTSVATKELRNRRDYSLWLCDVLNALGIKKVSIVGCSFGGFLAMSQASLTPERVTRVVLIGPAGTFVGLSWRFRLIMRLGPMLRRVRKLTGSPRPPGIDAFRPKGVPVHPEDGAWRALMSVTMSEGAKLNTINAPVFSKSILRKVRAKALLLIGEKETLYEPHTTLKLAAERLPGLTGAVVADADHIAAMAQPNDVNARILAFLAQN